MGTTKREESGPVSRPPHTWTTRTNRAQVSHSDRQVQLRRFLRGCEVEVFEREQSHDVGSLLQKAGTSDVIDAHLVITAARSASTVLTGDVTDLELLSSHLPRPVRCFGRPTNQVQPI